MLCYYSTFHIGVKGNKYVLKNRQNCMYVAPWQHSSSFNFRHILSKKCQKLNDFFIKINLKNPSIFSSKKNWWDPIKNTTFFPHFEVSYLSLIQEENVLKNIFGTFLSDLTEKRRLIVHFPPIVHIAKNQWMKTHYSFCIKVITLLLQQVWFCTKFNLIIFLWFHFNDFCKFTFTWIFFS